MEQSPDEPHQRVRAIVPVRGIHGHHVVLRGRAAGEVPQNGVGRVLVLLPVGVRRGARQAFRGRAERRRPRRNESHTGLHVQRGGEHRPRSVGRAVESRRDAQSEGARPRQQRVVPIAERRRDTRRGRGPQHN